jgi:cytochrome c-type biogenesis protein CcmH/NrfG
MAAVARVEVSRIMTASGQAAPAATLAAARAPEAPSPAQAVPVPVAVPVLPAETAVQEREAARRSLERGKIHDAIAAAERSTALDPTDAEAWLILGAAHQELGHEGAARGAFHSCTSSAKRGPVSECRAMLR